MVQEILSNSGLPDELKSLILSAVIYSPTPIIITNLNGNIEYVNPIFTQLTGYSFEEIKGKTPAVLKSFKTPASVYEDLWDTILAGRVWHGEICNKRKNGEEFWESISINAIKDCQGCITHFVGVWRDVSVRKQHEAEVLEQKQYFEKQSQTDELTGICNRRRIFAELEKELERACRYSRPLAGMMIDVDNFKKMNDQYGHLTGDRILKTFARVLGKSIRLTDILGRYGGDEFLLVLPETNLEEAKRVAERIRKNLRDYQEQVMDQFGIVTASIGLVVIDGFRPENKATFLDRIDKVLLLAKQAGKNTVVVG